MKLVESLLGRPIDAAARHSVQSLNDLSPSMLEELRRLSPSASAVNLYLSFHVVHYHGQSEDFVRDVVQGGADASSWGYRDLLVVVEETDEVTCTHMTWTDLVAHLEDIEGRRWCRLPNGPAGIENRDAWGAAGSAVGVLVCHVPYWWRCPRGRRLTTVSIGADLPVQLDEAAARIEFRRWIARRMSWWARDYLSAHAPTVTEAGILDAMGANDSSISRDAEIALGALVRECALPYHPDQDIRGFMGPAGWYTGER
jgi:hypothetical protein